MVENARPALTFGAEIEMVYVYELTDFHRLTGLPTGQYATARQRRDYVAEILRHQIPIETRSTSSLLGGVIVDDTRQPDYTQWAVTDDASIGAGPDEVSKLFHMSLDDAIARLHWDQIELISPIFSFAHQETWLPAFRQVQADLASRPHLGASFCNESCGLHVHFALESASPHIPWDPSAPPAFPLHVLQNLVILWAYWEANIESFHPFHRHAYWNIYAGSLRASAPHWKLENWERWAAHIYGLGSSDELRWFLGGVHTPKYVKLYISPAREHKRETVEFREHRGTTDAEEIRWWVVFIERVIQFCWSLAQSGFRFFLPGSVMLNMSHTEEMWGIIEMPEEGSDFLRGKIFEYAALDPESFYSSEGGSDVPGSANSATSIGRNLDNVDLDSLDDEDIVSDYTTKYMAADAVQPPVEDEGEIIDAVAEWGEMVRYGRADPVQ
jgi:hypothetical protein